MSNHVLALDLETTGLPEDKPSIIEIGCIHYNGEERVSEFQLRFQPKWDRNISLGALKVNKATPATLHTLPEGNQQLLTNAQGLEQFVQYLCFKVFPVIGNKKLKVLGQNVGFDIQLLKAGLEEINYNGWQYIFDHSIIDTSVIGNFLREAGTIELEKMSLGALAELLGVEVDKEKLHTALYDADISAKCYFALLKLQRNFKNGKQKTIS